MSDENITKVYLNKINEYLKHNKSYYLNSKPTISDKKFDDLKISILELEKKHKFLNHESSPSKAVGFKPSKNFSKLNHRVRMLSLSNVFKKNDLENFEKKIRNYLDMSESSKIEYSVEPKIDGISASLTYKNGNLISGVSRGDGSVGELITENLKTISDIPKKISFKDFPDDIDIRGEVFITSQNFNKIKGDFANARNAASGSLRQKDPNETKKIPLNFIAYTFGYIKAINLDKQSDFLKCLKKWGFKTSSFNKVITGVDELVKYHREFENKKHEIDYDLDGLVYKVNDFSLQNRLGFIANAPRWATAHKFSAESGYSKILNIEIQIGRTGALTPVAKIKPVNIGGVMVSNATLHNEDEIIRKDIRIGDIVEIERAGDVIPHVVSVNKAKRDKNSKVFVFPKKCPSCGLDIVKEYNNLTKKYDAVKRCPSEGYECNKIAIEKIKHFISKDALNIDGFGKKVLEKFWKLNFIRLPQDIFNLDYNKISKLDGWGNQSASNLKYAINKSKNISLDRFIFSLGIRHIGQENAKLLADHLGSIESLLKISSKYKFDNLLNIDGIGETQIKSIKKFFSNKINLNVIQKLSNSLEVKYLKTKNQGRLNGKTFMITGKLEGISRAEAKSLIEKNSGKILSSVSKKLDYLIIGTKPTPKKLKLAKELSINILNQTEFKKFLD